MEESNVSYHKIQKYPQSSKLVDIILYDIKKTTETAYNLHERPQETINYLIDECIRKKPVKTAYHNTINFFKRASDINKSAILGMFGSMIIQSSATTIASDYNFNQEQLHDVSYYAEMISYSLISAGTFYHLQRKKGNTFWESMWKLAKFGAAGAMVSATAYKWGRSELSELLITEVGFKQGTAELTSQFINIAPFALAVDWIGIPLKYIGDKTKITETIDKMVTNGINGVKKNGIKNDADNK